MNLTSPPPTTAMVFVFLSLFIAPFWCAIATTGDLQNLISAFLGKVATKSSSIYPGLLSLYIPHRD